MDFQSIREQIPATQKMVYLNTGWDGPSPRSVVQAVKDRVEYESFNGPTSPPVYQSGREIQQNAREAAASLLNVTSDEIVLTQCTTDGLNLVLNGLDWKEGDEVITFGLEHSSVLIPAYLLPGRFGVRLKVLDLNPTDTHEEIISRVAEAVSPRSRLLFFSHIQYTCGLRMPAEGLRKLTKDAGVQMLIDGAQTAGHIALDLRQLDCDYYSIPGQKWLLGPDGTGALFIRQDLIPSVAPTRVSGRAASSYDEHGGFEPSTDTMDKFLLTTSSAPLAAGFVEAVAFHQQMGSDVVEVRTRSLAGQLKQSLSEVPGVEVLSPTDDVRSCGLTSFKINGIASTDAVNRLWEEFGIVVRPVSELSCIRAATHAFNNQEDIQKLVSAVTALSTRSS